MSMRAQAGDNRRGRVLWLSGDVPYPTDSGRRSYSAGLAESVAAAGIDVIGLGSVEASTEFPDGRVDWRSVAPTWKPGAARRLLSRWPAMSVDRRSPAYRRALEYTLATTDVDVVVIDHLQMVWALDGLPQRGLPIAYVSHNHEASVRQGIARALPWTNPRRAAIAFDAERSARAERRLVRRASIVTAITESDAHAFREDGAEHVVVIPPGYGGPRSESRTIDEHTPRVAVVVTNLDWHVKQSNLRRLLAVADPEFARAGITLKIVGPAPDAFVADLTPRLRATEFTGRVPSVQRELEHARVGIIFEPDGGGFKLKALDYIFGRTPMVVLDDSAEGLPLEAGRDYLSFDSAETLTRGVIELIDDVGRCQTLQERAFEGCADAFDWADRGALLADAIAHRVPA